MKRFSLTLFLCVFVGLSGRAPSAQRAMGGLGLAGNVHRYVRLTPGAAWMTFKGGNETHGLSVTAHILGPDQLEVVLNGTEPSSLTEFNVPLQMRTNTAYQLKLTLISLEGCAPPMTASISSVRPSGKSVMSEAAEASRKEKSIDLTRCLVPLTILSGPRISALGNVTTPGNALNADLKLSISPSHNRSCAWRASFRVLLHAT